MLLFTFSLDYSNSTLQTTPPQHVFKVFKGLVWPGYISAPTQSPVQGIAKYRRKVRIPTMVDVLRQPQNVP